MPEQRALFNQFFGSLSDFGLKELYQIFETRLLGTQPNVSLLMEICEKNRAILDDNNSFAFIIDFKAMKLIYASQGVKKVTGFSSEEFLHGNLLFFMKHYCPADRKNGDKFLKEILRSLKTKEVNNNYLQQHLTTFRFFHAHGFYKWLMNRMFFIAFDENGRPLVLLSLLTDINRFRLNDSLHYVTLKLNKSDRIYEKESCEELKPQAIDILSKTDLEILNLLTKGFDNFEIAIKMQLSEHTIRDYRKKMLKKTWCANTCQLVDFALRNGLLNE